MRCSYEELENLYTQMIDHNFTSKEEPQQNENINTNISDYNFELQKLQIEAETERERIKIEAEKVTNKREILTTMLKEGILTFDQFKVCFEFC